LQIIVRLSPDEAFTLLAALLAAMAALVGRQH
jgi:hypothetical protein